MGVFVAFLLVTSKPLTLHHGAVLMLLFIIYFCLLSIPFIIPFITIIINSFILLFYALK